jgi:2-isopropylmalate synthase
MNLQEPLKLINCSASSSPDDPESVICKSTILFGDEESLITGTGNGHLSAFVDALRAHGINGFDIADFHEQSMGAGAGTEAVAYVEIKDAKGAAFWGAGKHTDITMAGIRALVSSYNKLILAASKE